MWILPLLFNPRMTSCELCYQQNYRSFCQCSRLPGVSSQSTEWLKNSVEPETLYYARMSRSTSSSKTSFSASNCHRKCQIEQTSSDYIRKVGRWFWMSYPDEFGQVFDRFQRWQCDTESHFQQEQLVRQLIWKVTRVLPDQTPRHLQ